MILNRRVALDGVQLDELDERIVIRSIDPGVPKESLQAVNQMGGSGQRMTMQHWESLDIVVSYAIDIYQTEMEARKAVFDMVNEWALKKGWLTVNWIPGRRVWIDKAIVPGSGDLWAWTGEYTITFRAYSVPFWQDETAVSAVNANVTNGGVTLQVPGNVRTVIDATFVNISGMNIQNVAFSCRGKALVLNGVNLGAGKTLAISHGNDGLLRAYKGSESVYGLITGSDDLTADPGSTAVTVSATRAGRFTAACFGRYV